MTIRYTVQADEAALAEVKALFEFLGGNTTTATRIAINKAGKRTLTESSKSIRSQIRLQANYVTGIKDEEGNRRLDFKRATHQNLTGRITTPSRGILLSRFSTDPEIATHKYMLLNAPPVPPKGIRVKVKPKGPVKTFHGDNETDGKPFFMRLDNGQIAIAARLKGSVRAAAVERGSGIGSRDGRIKVFYGPSLSQVFTEVKNKVPAGQILTEEMADAIRYLLRIQVPKE